MAVVKGLPFRAGIKKGTLVLPIFRNEKKKKDFIVNFISRRGEGETKASIGIEGGGEGKKRSSYSLITYPWKSFRRPVSTWKKRWVMQEGRGWISIYDSKREKNNLQQYKKQSKVESLARIGSKKTLLKRRMTCTQRTGNTPLDSSKRKEGMALKRLGRKTSQVRERKRGARMKPLPLWG